MNPESSPHHEDEIPSFQSIVENDLGLGEAPQVKWQGPNLISDEVLVHLLPHYEGWMFVGAGGMGVVYKAWHRELQRWAAIKFLTPRQCCDPRAVARFQNEAKILAQLRHPNIVPVHDFGCQGDLAWLVMDFLDGMPLQVWAREKKRKPTEIALMMAKVARSVGVAHASGIVHRDLKPGNIMVMGEEPVLLDFGLAQKNSWQEEIRLTQEGELAGTVAYLAPEQVAPELGEPSPATDVHACGVMLYEMLASRLPRVGLASQIITRLHEDDQPPRLHAAMKPVCKELDAICWHAMQKKPEARYANGISLAEDLERFLDGRPIRAKNPDLVDMAYLYLRRYPWVAAAGAVALAALALSAWSTHRMQWSQNKARLLSQINRQLTEADWTPDRLALTDGLLNEMHRVDTVLERYLKENVLKRTHRRVVDLLEAPRLTEEETAQMPVLLRDLIARGHPESSALLKRWRARESAWQPLASLRPPITQLAGEVIFQAGAWDSRLGELYAQPKVPGQTWSTLMGKFDLQGSVELEAEFHETWQEAKTCGVNLILPVLGDIRFQVFHPARFAAHLPKFENPGNAPVMAILSGKMPLAYAFLPQEVRASPHLILRCRYENGDLSFSVNGGEALRHTRIFELTRPLSKAQFSVLLPVESSLARFELRGRDVKAAASPLAKADDLFSIGKPHEALAIYEKYLNRADVKAECLYKYAACLEALQKKADAIATWAQVAQNQAEPWKSLAMFQIWRSHLIQGDMDSANAWFDLLMGSRPPEIVRMGIPASDLQLLNEHYQPITRSLNCLKVGPEDMAALDRAVRVQHFLGADDRQTAVRTAMAFHFAGRDQQARKLLTEAVTQVRPSAALPEIEMQRTLACLDQWAALGEAEADPVLRATVTSWLHALEGSQSSCRAIPCLEDLRHEMRTRPPLKAPHLDTLRQLTATPSLHARHRIEAWLLTGLVETDPALRRKAWLAAAQVEDVESATADNTQQRLHSEFVARSLAQNWTAAEAIEWMSTLLGKSRPLVTQGRWIGPIVQALAGDALAQALNQVLQSGRGQQLARDYILRRRAARELAHETMELFLSALFAQGSHWPVENPHVQKCAQEIVSSFCRREFSEVALMQLFSLWSGVKNQATWDLLAGELKPALREPLATLLVRRYEVLGQPQAAAEFRAASAEKEKPAPKTTRVTPEEFPD